MKEEAASGSDADRVPMTAPAALFSRIPLEVRVRSVGTSLTLRTEAVTALVKESPGVPLSVT